MITTNKSLEDILSTELSGDFSIDSLINSNESFNRFLEYLKRLSEEDFIGIIFMIYFATMDGSRYNDGYRVFDLLDKEELRYKYNILEDNLTRIDWLYEKATEVATKDGRKFEETGFTYLETRKLNIKFRLTN